MLDGGADEFYLVRSWHAPVGCNYDENILAIDLYHYAFLAAGKYSFIQEECIHLGHKECFPD